MSSELKAATTLHLLDGTREDEIDCDRFLAMLTRSRIFSFLVGRDGSRFSDSVRLTAANKQAVAQALAGIRVGARGSASSLFQAVFSSVTFGNIGEPRSDRDTTRRTATRWKSVVDHQWATMRALCTYA